MLHNPQLSQPTSSLACGANEHGHGHQRWDVSTVGVVGVVLASENTGGSCMYSPASTGSAPCSPPKP